MSTSGDTTRETPAAPRAVGVPANAPLPHFEYRLGSCYGCDPNEGVHLYSLPQRDPRSVQFGEGLGDDILLHYPLLEDQIHNRNLVRIVHSQAPEYGAQMDWFIENSSGFDIVALEELVSPTGCHSGLALVANHKQMLVVRTDPIYHLDWVQCLDDRMLEFLKTRRGILAAGSTLYRLWQAELPGFDMVRATAEAFVYGSPRWSKRYLYPSVLDLGVWAPHEVLWGNFVGYARDQQHLHDLQARFPQREALGEDSLRSNLTNWGPELLPSQISYLYNTGSCYWVTIKLQLMQYASDGFIPMLDYFDTFLAFIDLKVDYKLPPRRLPRNIGSEESDYKSVRAELVEAVRALTAPLQYPEPDPDPVGRTDPDSENNAGASESDDEMDHAQPGDQRPAPLYPLGEPDQPQGLDVAPAPKLPGRQHQTGRGGKYAQNWDLEPEVVPDRYLPEKYRRVAVLDKLCIICGSAEHHKKKCPTLRHLRQTGRGESDVHCPYPFCRGRGHSLKTCPVLHALCACGRRGHTIQECHLHSKDHKEATYREHRPQGTVLSLHLEDPEWDYAGPSLPISDLVPVFTPHHGYVFIEPAFAPALDGVRDLEDLREVIHKAHFY